jgi:hypothetical protein
MTNDRLDYFIEQLLWHLNYEGEDVPTRRIIELAQHDLEVEDKRQEVIENQALEDAHYTDRYGKGE